jgi:hypothetical protein
MTGGFFGSVGFYVRRFCFYVNLPLLHRLRVGIAKVKVKVKSCKIHENLVIEWIDYNNISAQLASNLSEYTRKFIKALS